MSTPGLITLGVGGNASFTSLMLDGLKIAPPAPPPLPSTSNSAPGFFFAEGLAITISPSTT